MPFFHCGAEQAGLIHSFIYSSLHPAGLPGLFWTSRDAALSVSSVNTDLIKRLMPRPPLPNPQSPSAAHQRPGVPTRPAEWQHHKSQGCIKNTLGRRKELGLHFSDTESLFSSPAAVGALVHHHRLSDNVVTYGPTKCTPKHVQGVWTTWVSWIDVMFQLYTYLFLISLNPRRDGVWWETARKRSRLTGGSRSTESRAHWLNPKNNTKAFWTVNQNRKDKYSKFTKKGKSTKSENDLKET